MEKNKPLCFLALYQAVACGIPTLPKALCAHALQADFHRRFTKQVLLLLFYTLSASSANPRKRWKPCGNGMPWRVGFSPRKGLSPAWGAESVAEATRKLKLAPHTKHYWGTIAVRSCWRLLAASAFTLAMLSSLMRS